MSHFGFHLTLSPELALSIDHAPLSIITKSDVKIKKLTVSEGFFESTNYNDEYLHHQKLNKVIELLGGVHMFNSITDLVINYSVHEHAGFFVELMKRLKNLKSLEFYLDMFCRFFDNFEGKIHVESIESFTVHFDGFFHDSERIERALIFFPNTKEIHLKYKEYGNLDVIKEFAPKIKSMSELKVRPSPQNEARKSTLIDLHNDPRIACDISVHYEDLLPRLTSFFDQRFDMITEFSLEMPYLEGLTILRNLPNLRKFKLSYIHHKNSHFFGHELIEFPKLQEVELIASRIDCHTCIEKMFESFKHMKILNITKFENFFENDTIHPILEKIHLEELRCKGKHLKYFGKKRLRRIVLNTVGLLTKDETDVNPGHEPEKVFIEDLARDCPLLETIEFYKIDFFKPTHLKAVVELFPNLRYLTMKGFAYGDFYNSSESFVNDRVSRLKSLVLECNLGSDDKLTLFRQLKNLQRLESGLNVSVLTRREFHQWELENNDELENESEQIKKEVILIE